MLGHPTQGGSMVGADESTELWRHPTLHSACLNSLDFRSSFVVANGDERNGRSKLMRCRQHHLFLKKQFTLVLVRTQRTSLEEINLPKTIQVEIEMTSWTIKLPCRAQALAENAHTIRTRGGSTVYFIGLESAALLTQNLITDFLVWLDPNQSNRRSAVQWYFPLQSKWVFSDWTIWTLATDGIEPERWNFDT